MPVLQEIQQLPVVRLDSGTEPGVTRWMSSVSRRGMPVTAGHTALSCGPKIEIRQSGRTVSMCGQSDGWPRTNRVSDEG